MKTIQTVTGETDVSSLGSTLTHEHFISLDWSMRIAFPEGFDADLFEQRAVLLVNDAMKRGLRSIVDLTCINNGRDVELMRRICSQTGLNCIFSTGLYFNEEPWIPGRDPLYLAELFIKELLVGVGTTGCRPGVIKCATDRYGFSEINLTLLRAAAIAAQRTDVPLFTHTLAYLKQGTRQQDLFEDEGVDLRRVVIGHSGDTSDLDYLEEIMKRGSYVGLDRFGSDATLTEAEKIHNLLTLIDRGYIHQLLIAHDMPMFYDWGDNNWQKEKARPLKEHPGFSHILKNVLPLLRDRGVSDAEIDTLLIENPRVFFSL